MATRPCATAKRCSRTFSRSEAHDEPLRPRDGHRSGPNAGDAVAGRPPARAAAVEVRLRRSPREGRAVERDGDRLRAARDELDVDVARSRRALEAPDAGADRDLDAASAPALRERGAADGAAQIGDRLAVVLVEREAVPVAARVVVGIDADDELVATRAVLARAERVHRE